MNLGVSPDGDGPNSFQKQGNTPSAPSHLWVSGGLSIASVAELPFLLRAAAGPERLQGLLKVTQDKELEK